MAEARLDGVVLPMGRLEFDPTTGLSGRARVVQRMQQCDVLLLIHGELSDCLEYIPSKLYDYFWARRPVLALTYANEQLDALVRAHDGFVAPSKDQAAIVAAYEAAVARWQARALPGVAAPPVTVEAAVKRIVEAARHG
jgi:hypothetical protein